MLPTFIVIGAAKAGTTALYWYLAEHPEVFMSQMKETNYFAFGVDDAGELLYGVPDLHRFRIRRPEDYEALFADAGEAIAIGEASPIYLECPQAADRIRRSVPEARIVCGLRDPVDRAYSDYQMFLRNRGRRLVPDRDLRPDAPWAQPDSHWMRIGRYHEMLSRYYDAFPREQILPYLFDDLRTDPAGVVRGIYRFVGVDPWFAPDLNTPHNRGGVPAHMIVERFLTSDRLRRTVEPVVPGWAADAARRLRTRNLRKAPPLPQAMREAMARHFHDDVMRASELIGRNLDQWLDPSRQAIP